MARVTLKNGERLYPAGWAHEGNKVFRCYSGLMVDEDGDDDGLLVVRYSDGTFPGYRVASSSWGGPGALEEWTGRRYDSEIEAEDAAVEWQRGRIRGPSEDEARASALCAAASTAALEAWRAVREAHGLGALNTEARRLAADLATLAIDVARAPLGSAR